jgi:hypothetical protein
MAKGGKRVKSRRVRSRKSAHGDSITLKTLCQSADITAASNAAAGLIAIDARANGVALGAGGSSIANNFQTYKFLSLTLKWLPKVGPGGTSAGGRVYVAYVDNPEQIVTWAGLTAAQALTKINSFRNVLVFNVWKELVYRVPLTYRRNMFDVNNTTTDSVDVDDRSVQGAVLWAVETIGATDIVGSWQTKGVVHLRGLHSSLTT